MILLNTYSHIAILIKWTTLQYLSHSSPKTSFPIFLQREGSPTDVEVEKMLAEARSDLSLMGGACIDDDIIVQEYFSDDESKVYDK